MRSALPDQCLDQLFRQARTHNTWLDKPVTDEMLRQIEEATQLP